VFDAASGQAAPNGRIAVSARPLGAGRTVMFLEPSRLRDVDRLDRTIAPDTLAFEDEDFRLRGAVELTGDIRKDAQKVRVTGHIRATLECDCGRCLEPFPVPVDTTFDLLFLPATANKGREDQAVAEDDLGVAFYKDDVIDLRQLIREQFYLALPMKPLCRDDCQGLCPVCGINRNREVCSCDTAWVDPRFDALRKLKERG
jgi:uncharacterized protein